MLLLTDTPGVLGEDGKVIERLSAPRASELMATGTISGGMIPKVEFALSAMRRGVANVAILDGREPGALAAALQGRAAGTIVSKYA
ncbi:MAG: hypothetical protein IPL79_06430 [Myxococcales bacterium]|nr:hypothetical protein [Myxococcales bacterium]